VKQNLSPKELALAIEVSESSVKRWVDDGLIRASRTAGGHRRIPTAEAIRFIRETHSTVTRPELLGVPDPASIQDAISREFGQAAALHSFLADGKAEEARGLVLWLYLAGASVASICDGPLREALARIGELWRERKDGIFIEHRATEIALTALLQLRGAFSPPDDGPCAVGGAPSGDPYLLPSTMASTTLMSEGIRAINLGPETPLETLRIAAEQHEAALVWLSVTHVRQPAVLERDLNRLLETLADRGTSLILGGQAAAKIRPRPAASLCAGSSMGELVAFAKGRCSTTPKSADAGSPKDEPT
jgi:excisionase family DNA binding protein